MAYPLLPYLTVIEKRCSSVSSPRIRDNNVAIFFNDVATLRRLLFILLIGCYFSPQFQRCTRVKVKLQKLTTPISL